MARTLEFDYETAVHRATRQFWETGYAGTSLRVLLGAMGIGEGSFYNTLKSKKLAYLACLEHYKATELRNQGEAVQFAPTAAMGIRALFKVILDCLDNPDTPLICLMARSLTPQVLEEAELRQFVEREMTTFQQYLAERLQADKDAGVLSPNLHPQVIAPVVITYIQGMWRMALVDYDRPQWERQIDTFLTALGL